MQFHKLTLTVPLQLSHLVLLMAATGTSRLMKQPIQRMPKGFEFEAKNAKLLEFLHQLVCNTSNLPILSTFDIVSYVLLLSFYHRSPPSSLASTSVGRRVQCTCRVRG